MKKIGTWILILAIIAGGIGGFLWWRNRQSETASNNDSILRTAVVAYGDLKITVPASGHVEVKESIELSFELPGKVMDLNVEINDHVAAEQELARLDTRDLERTVRQAEIALEQAELNQEILTEPASEEDIQIAELAVQKAGYTLGVAETSKTAAAAQGNLNIRLAEDAKESTEEAYESFLDNMEKYGIPEGQAAGIRAAYMEADGNVGITYLKAEQQTQQAQSQWLIAFNSYQQAAQNLERLQSGPDENQIKQNDLQIEQARLSLEQAQNNLTNAIIKAPFAGTVAAVNLKVSLPAPTGFAAITLLDDAAFFVDITVDEIDVSKVALEQMTEVTLDAYPNIVLEGTVESIDKVATSVGGIVAYAVRIRLEENADVALKQGMTSSVVIQTSEVNDVLLVPNWAIRTDQSSGETYVYIVENGALQRNFITTKARDNTHTQISGLDEGTTVALVSEERNLMDFQGPPSGMR